MNARVPPRLPDFIIAGAQKCGTTSLHHYLDAHPRLFLPRRPQELHFFDFDANYEKGMQWYSAHFAKAAPDQKAGQTSPLYLYDERVPARLAGALPSVRIIVLLRDPVKRAYSHYWHQVKKGTEELPFAQALACEQQRLAGDYDSRRWYSYVDRGRYSRQLERFERHFPRRQLLVLGTEALASQPAATLERCFEFLGVEPLPRNTVDALTTKRFNASRLPRSPRLQQWIGRHRQRAPLLAVVVDKVNLRPAALPPMSDAARSFLVQQFSGELARLDREFGVDTSTWTSAPGNA